MQNNPDFGEKPADRVNEFFRRRRRKLIIAVCAFLVAIVIGPTVLCEVLTAIHIAEFEDARLEEFGVEYKVISYNYEKAKIYVYTLEGKEEDCIGGIVKLSREGETWEITGWEPMWTKGDDPDRIVWQYWWHARYFLF